MIWPLIHDAALHTTHADVLSHFSRVRFFATLWIVACQAPLTWDSPGTITGVGCHALLQEILPTQGLNPRLLHLLHCRQVLYSWATREAPSTPSILWKSPLNILSSRFQITGIMFTRTAETAITRLTSILPFAPRWQTVIIIGWVQVLSCHKVYIQPSSWQDVTIRPGFLQLCTGRNVRDCEKAF